MQVDLLGLCCALCLQITSGTSGRDFFSKFKVNTWESNIALHKRAHQSGTIRPGHPKGYTQGFAAVASKAVDGNTDDNFSHQSCSMTWEKPSHIAWWEVDLRHQFRIGCIRIRTRKNRQPFIFSDITIDVYKKKRSPKTKKKCTTHAGITRRSWLNLTCDSPVTGRFVKISKPVGKWYKDQLVMCEVEIYKASSTSSQRPVVSDSLTSTSFQRKTPTATLTGNKELMVRSALHCATFCVTRGCTGFVVERKKTGDMGCLINPYVTCQ